MSLVHLKKKKKRICFFIKITFCSFIVTLNSFFIKKYRYIIGIIGISVYLVFKVIFHTNGYIYFFEHNYKIEILCL